MTGVVRAVDSPVAIPKCINGTNKAEMYASGQDGELLNFAIAVLVQTLACGDATLPTANAEMFVDTPRSVTMIGAKPCKALRSSAMKMKLRSSCATSEHHTPSFISKTYNVNLMDLATCAMLASPVHVALLQPINMEHAETGREVGVQVHMSENAGL